jgi:hypothetical protein
LSVSLYIWCVLNDEHGLVESRSIRYHASSIAHSCLKSHSGGMMLQVSVKYAYSPYELSKGCSLDSNPHGKT